MSTLSQTSSIPLGTTIYWQGAPVVFHGIATGTDCAVIKQDKTDKVGLLVELKDLTTSAEG